MSRYAVQRKRVLVLVEPGRGGGAVISYAGALADAEGTTLTVVGIAPHAPRPRCGTSLCDYNLAVAEAVATDLGRARERLSRSGSVVSSELLVEGRGRSLAQFTAAGDFDLVLLPARRRWFGAASHPAARDLRTATDAEIRVVDPRMPPTVSVGVAA